MYLSTAFTTVLGLFLTSATAIPAVEPHPISVEPHKLVSRQASSYQLEFFSGTSCTGSTGFFGGDEATGSCVSVIGNFDSVQLTNPAGCSTVIFTDAGCTQSRFLLPNTDCSGYTDGSPIRGVIINC
ncbi:hypothetical protein B7463_g2369, partial [Scytalidium lignicola]